MEAWVDDVADLFGGTGERDDAGQTKTLTLYAVPPDPNFPDLDGDGIPDNLPNPDEGTGGGGGGGGGDGTGGTPGSGALSVSFEGLARACAGGLDDDVHTFTIRGTTENADGNPVPGAKLALYFENNRGRGKARQVRARHLQQPNSGDRHRRRRDDDCHQSQRRVRLESPQQRHHLRRHHGHGDVEE